MEDLSGRPHAGRAVTRRDAPDVNEVRCRTCGKLWEVRCKSCDRPFDSPPLRVEVEPTSSWFAPTCDCEPRPEMVWESEPAATQESDTRINDPLLLRVEDVMKRLGVGRTTVYGLIKSGDLESVMLGGRRLVPTDAVVALVDRVRAEAR